MTMKNLYAWISPLSFDTRILISFVDFSVAAWLVNHSISCHSVNPPLIFSAISIGLCVDGKCCRKLASDWLFGKTTMQSIKLSINWLDAYLIAWLINQSGERLTMHLLIQSYIHLIAIMSSWAIGWLVRTSTNRLNNHIVDWIHGWASNQLIEKLVIRLSNWSFTVYPSQMNSIETLLNKILRLVETQHAHLPTPEKERIYDNKSLMALLGIKDRYLKRLRDNGLLGYSRHGDKYWYTQSDIDRFLARCHYAPFADKQWFTPKSRLWLRAKDGIDFEIIIVSYVIQHVPILNSNIIAKFAFKFNKSIMETKTERLKLNRIKAVLAETGHTGKWLAEQLGKDPATVSKWCTNASQPDLYTLYEIAKTLKINVINLIHS